MLIFSVGIDGCGMREYSLKLKKIIPNIEIIDTSEISHLCNEDIEQITLSLLRNYFEKNQTVYYSGKMLTPKNRKEIFSLCKKFNQQMIGVVFCTSFRKDICLRRSRIEKDRMDFQWKKFLSLTKDISVLENEMKNSSNNFRIKYIECEA